MVAKPPEMDSFITLEAFLRLPETKPASEYADGRVTQKMSPKARHSQLQRRLLQHLDRMLGPTYGAFPELRCTFGGRSLVPDIAIFRTDRLPRDESGELADDALGAPDAAVEIRSPGQSVSELVERLSFCVENGVRFGLLVDPVVHRAVVFAPEDYPVEIGEGGSIDGGDRLPGLHLPVSELWGWLKL